MRRLSLIALVLGGCAMPATPDAKDVARDRLVRSSYAVPALGLTISMLSRGDPHARRVIFVHGTPGSATAWEHYIARPPQRVEAVAVDRPGFGATLPRGAMPSLRAQAAAIAPLLVARGGQWPILVGHSLGGPIVAQVAADNPGKVGGLLILAGSFDPGVERTYWVQYMGEWPMIRSMLPGALRSANRELMALKPDLEALAPRLGALRCPVRVVHGTKDGNVPYSNVAFLRAHLTHAASFDVTTLPGQNHFIVWNEEPAVRAALAALLAEPATPC